MRLLPALPCALLLAGALAFTGARGPDDPRFRTNRAGARALALPDEDQQAFTFAVFGDRTGGPPEGVQVLAQAVEEVNLLAPDLVMTVGDLVQGYNTTPEWLVQMEEFRGIMDRLAMPWFPVPGNHDVYWRGPERPAREHEENYERHFGPLWYGFRHKDCWFIALYADETNPETGEKHFDDPAHQRMSPEQLAWLEGTLAEARGARHVFLFLHHPRWIGGQYGDDWERVHQLLLAAGNVTAVFAGHIHHMRYDPRDGIEYFALATVGGDQQGDLPQAGYLHQYTYVTVRGDGIETVSYPVGSARDPRLITGAVSTEARRAVRELRAAVQGRVELDLEAGTSGELALELANPLALPVELTLRAAGGDARWSVDPPHVHLVLEPGARRSLAFGLRRPAGPIDAAFRLPELVRSADVLFPELRVPLPDVELALPVAPRAFPAPPDAAERALALDGSGACLALRSEEVPLPDGPFTLEAWIRPEAYAGRRGVLCKTEGSEYGLFVDDGKPSFAVHLDGAYARAEAGQPILALGRWQHVAGVFDGASVALYVDGVRQASAPASGARTRNSLPLVVGADVRSDGSPVSFFAGALDEVRLARGARYAGERCDPARRLEPDEGTLLLLHMDAELGPWVRDASPAAAHPVRWGEPRLCRVP